MNQKEVLDFAKEKYCQNTCQIFSKEEIVLFERQNISKYLLSTKVIKLWLSHLSVENKKKNIFNKFLIIKITPKKHLINI